ncbi:hypothetical protein ACQP1W_36880 [Spirillospora sp. CA-255316]
MAVSYLPPRRPTTTPAPVGESGFYVSVRTSARIAESALVLGPFPDRDTAHAHIPLVRRYVAARHRGGEWWRFTTPRITARPGRPLPDGTLNEILGVRDGAA